MHRICLTILLLSSVPAWADQAASPSDEERAQEFCKELKASRDEKVDAFLCVPMHSETPSPPYPLQVGNGKLVRVAGNKFPTHSCTVEVTKRTPIEPSAGIAAGILALLNVGGAFAAAIDTEPSWLEPCTKHDISTESLHPRFQVLKEAIEEFEKMMTTRAEALKNLKDLFQQGAGSGDLTLQEALKNLGATGSKERLEDPQAVAAMLQVVVQRGGPLREQPILTVTDLPPLLAALQARVAGVGASTPDEQKWAKAAELRLSCLGGKIEELKNSAATLEKARQGVRDAYNAAQERLTDPYSNPVLKPEALRFGHTLSRERQTRSEGKVTCANAFNPKDKFEVSFSVSSASSYTTLSGGFAATMQDETVYAVESFRVGEPATAGGPVKTESRITDARKIDFQAMPFSFLNLRWCRFVGNCPVSDGDWPVDPRFSIGVGINPNGSGTAVEYMLSPLTLNVPRIHTNIHFGLHWGRRQELKNGFGVNEVVSGVSSPPVRNPYKPGFGFGVSYELPLPKAK